MLSYNLFSIGNNNEYWTYLKSAANTLGMDWRALDTYCYIENGRRLDDNNGNQYRGILQWGNGAAKSLGYSNSAQMIAQNNTYELQFQLVIKWIRLLWRTYGRRTEAGYLYLCHFLPVNAPHYSDKSYVLRGENSRLVKRGYDYYDQNSGLDYNQDGYITVGDIDNIVRAKAKNIGYDLGTPTYESDVAVQEDSFGEMTEVLKMVVFASIIIPLVKKLDFTTKRKYTRRNANNS